MFFYRGMASGRWSNHVCGTQDARKTKTDECDLPRAAIFQQRLGRGIRGGQAQGTQQRQEQPVHRYDCMIITGTWLWRQRIPNNETAPTLALPFTHMSGRSAACWHDHKGNHGRTRIDTDVACVRLGFSLSVGPGDYPHALVYQKNPCVSLFIRG